jgi:hypothetical protein
VCRAAQGKISADWFGAGQKLIMKNLCFSWMQQGLH